jgi:ABC-type xylose transport system permease subunit
MTLLKVSVFWQQLVTSLILLIAVSLDYLSEKARIRKLSKA